MIVRTGAGQDRPAGRRLLRGDKPAGAGALSGAGRDGGLRLLPLLQGLCLLRLLRPHVSRTIIWVAFFQEPQQQNRANRGVGPTGGDGAAAWASRADFVTALYYGSIGLLVLCGLLLNFVLEEAGTGLLGLSRMVRANF